MFAQTLFAQTLFAHPLFARALLTLPFSPALTILLITSGTLLIFLELNRPGWILPGCFGLLMLLLAADSIWHGPAPQTPLFYFFACVCLALLDTRKPHRTLLMCLLFAMAACFFTIAPDESNEFQIFVLSTALALSVLTHFLATMAALARKNKTVSPAHPSSPETF